MTEFSLEQVGRVLSISDGRLRYWQRLGLFPRHPEGYDWSDLRRAKEMAGFLEEGHIAATRLAPHAALLWKHRLHSQSRTLVLEDENGARDVESGQFLFNFENPETVTATPQTIPQPEEWERQAQQALEQGDDRRALEFALRAAENPGHDVFVLNNLGLLLLHLNEVDTATEILERACRCEDAEARQFFNLSHALEAGKDYQGSLRALEESLLLDPDFSAARFNLAYSYEALGDKEQAYQHWRSFLERHPENKDAEKIREHLGTFEPRGQVISFWSKR